MDVNNLSKSVNKVPIIIIVIIRIIIIMIIIIS